MTPEARLDRLERIAKLFVKAGLRPRRNMRDMDEKPNLLVSMQKRYSSHVKAEKDHIAFLH